MKTVTSLAAGVAAGVGATACCFLPLALVALGAGGAWAGRVQALAAFQPILLGMALLFMGLAFHRLYIRPRRCEPGEACANPHVLRRQRGIFWTLLALVAAINIAPFLVG